MNISRKKFARFSKLASTGKNEQKSELSPHSRMILITVFKSKFEYVFRCIFKYWRTKVILQEELIELWTRKQNSQKIRISICKSECHQFISNCGPDKRIFIFSFIICGKTWLTNLLMKFIEEQTSSSWGRWFKILINIEPSMEILLASHRTRFSHQISFSFEFLGDYFLIF